MRGELCGGSTETQTHEHSINAVVYMLQVVQFIVDSWSDAYAARIRALFPVDLIAGG